MEQKGCGGDGERVRVFFVGRARGNKKSKEPKQTGEEISQMIKLQRGTSKAEK